MRKPNPTFRCVLSGEGLEIHPGRGWPNREGTVCGESRDGCCWKVRWDGTRTPQTYHKSFIILLDPPWEPVNDGLATLADILWRSTSETTNFIEKTRLAKGSMVKGNLHAVYIGMCFQQGNGTLIALYRDWKMPPLNAAQWSRVGDLHRQYL